MSADRYPDDYPGPKPFIVEGRGIGRERVGRPRPYGNPWAGWSYDTADPSRMEVGRS